MQGVGRPGDGPVDLPTAPSAEGPPPGSAADAWVVVGRRHPAGPADREAVGRLLGRPPEAGFEVAVRGSDGRPVVIRNEPFLDDGTPMPTTYWLVDPGLRAAIGGIESAGGVRQAEAAVDPVDLRRAHDRYAAERDQAIVESPHGPPPPGAPRPSGGVAGTRQGVKCLHAHYAWFLAGGDDPVGRWVHEHLQMRQDPPS